LHCTICLPVWLQGCPGRNLQPAEERPGERKSVRVEESAARSLLSLTAGFLRAVSENKAEKEEQK
jgi:hypothetical protein